MGRTITAIQVQKRNKERVSIFLDGEYAFGLPMIEAAHLRKGQILAEQDISQLQAIDERHQAYEYAVRYLGHRPRSIREIRRKLAQRDVEDVVIDHVIERLDSLGYVDDLEFARWWVRNREEFRPRGPMALRAELRKKGIDNAFIDQAIEELVDPLDSARKAAQKKFSNYRRADDITFRRRMTGYLSRRGFDYDTVRTVIDELLDEE
jgi:regulatory protein